jgi:hypothetical protein
MTVATQSLRTTRNLMMMTEFMLLIIILVKIKLKREC